MAKYRISEKAKIDIIEIWEYTFEKWSLNQADKYYNLILDEIEHIANAPKSGKLYSNLRKDYFGILIKTHIIFYKLDSKNEVEIIRILHSKMDLSKR